MQDRHLRLAAVTPVGVVLALTLVGASLRLPALFSGELHGDEALFATWARLIGTWRDPLLSAEIVDKPPLLFYLQAALYPLLGSPELWVARLPGLFASIVTVPLTARFVWNLFKDDLAAVLAATVVAFSPLLVRYSATAVLDPLLGCLALASLVAASATGGAVESKAGSRRVFVAALLLGLAVVTKYQAVLFFPLHVLVVMMKGSGIRLARRWLIGFMLPLFGLAIWLTVRGGNMDLWGQQMESFGGLRLAWSWELWSRLEGWGAHWGQLLGAPVLAFALLLFLPVFLALLIQHQDRATAYDQLLVLFLVAYGLLLWLVAVPVWDRYLVAVAPVAAIVLGRFVSKVLAFVQPAIPLPARGLTGAISLGFLLLMAPAGVEAREASEGGAGSVREGVEAVGHFLHDAPYGTVLYDHWYSWQWRYTLLDSRVYVSWFAHPQALLTDLEAFLGAEDQRYLVLPREPESQLVRRNLAGEGFALDVVLETERMILYRIGP